MRSFLSAFIAALALVTAAAPALAAQGRTTTNCPTPGGAGEQHRAPPHYAGWLHCDCRLLLWRVVSRHLEQLFGLYAKSGLVITAATRTRGRVRGGEMTADGSQLWPILPPYPYRSGYYPKADWYHDIPPYVAIEPSFYRRRYFMILQEHDRYRFTPYVFSGDRYGGGRSKTSICRK